MLNSPALLSRLLLASHPMYWRCSVNDSEYGLQAGVFTHDLDKAWHAFEKLDVGGVVVGHVPSIRVDAQVALTPCPLYVRLAEGHTNLALKDTLSALGPRPAIHHSHKGCRQHLPAGVAGLAGCHCCAASAACCWGSCALLPLLDDPPPGFCAAFVHPSMQVSVSSSFCAIVWSHEADVLRSPMGV